MVSIIIPVYNEETTIKGLLRSFFYDSSIEVIIADGGSSDRTVELAREYPVKIIQCRKNRAAQMNKGAKMARGDIFLFLHADSIMESGSREAIEKCVHKGYSGGCLSQRINSPEAIYRFIEISGNIRAKLFKIFYGDQAIFVRRDIFFKIGGFNDVDLFEDIIFSKKLKNIGKTCVLNKKVHVSPRRWQTQGISKTTLINWLVTLGFLFGVPHRTLKRIYSDIR